VALAAHPAGLAQHLEVVADGGLCDVTAGREVARADTLATGQLAEDLEPGGVRRSLEEQRVGVRDALHAARVLTSIYIVKYQYKDRGASPAASIPNRSTMIPTIELVHAIERDRERALGGSVLARRSACYRSCCAPNRLDHLAALLGRANDCSEGSH